MTTNEATVRTGELEFRLLCAGPTDGRPVLLLHGFPQSSGEWRSQIRALAAAGYRAVAPDQRGYSPGARPAELAQYGLDLLIDDVIAVAGELGFGRFDLVGHDWGAIVAWGVAARHDDRIRTLTAVSVPHPSAFADAYADADGDQRRMSSYIDVFRADGQAGERMLAGEGEDGIRQMFEHIGLTVETAAEHAAVLGQEGALTAALNWYRATHPTLIRDLPTVSVPTLFVWSTLDPAISQAAAEGCTLYMTGPYRFEILEQVGHWIPELEAERLNRLLLEHLGSN